MLDLQPIDRAAGLQLVRLPEVPDDRGAYAVATAGGLVLHRDLTLDEARALLATMAAEQAARAEAPPVRRSR